MTLLSEMIDLVVITYNHQDFIDDCLSSIERQTLRPSSITIIDDCSKDRTMEKITDFANRTANVNVIKHKKRMGITKTANHALRTGKNEYIKILCGDDYLSDCALEVLAVALKNAPTATFAYSNMAWFYKLPLGFKVSIKHYTFYARPTSSIQSLIDDNTLPAPTLMIRRSNIKNIWFPEEFSTMSDLIFILMCLEVGPAIYVDNVTINYRRHGFNSSSIFTYKDDRILLSSLLKQGKYLKRHYNSAELENLIKYSNLLTLIKEKRIRNSTLLAIKMTNLSMKSPKWFLRILFAWFRIAKLCFMGLFL